jgi:hypothetical protein
MRLEKCVSNVVIKFMSTFLIIIHFHIIMYEPIEFEEKPIQIQTFKNISDALRFNRENPRDVM